MEMKELLRTYRRRLGLEAWVKSGIVGALIAGFMCAICSLVFWTFGIKLFWVSIIVFVVSAGISVPTLYFLKFKASNKDVARRIDALGLEERILTMTELEGDESFMAQKQREDTKTALQTVNASLLKFAVSIPLVVIACVALIAGTGTTIASAVAEESLKEIIQNRVDDIVLQPKEYEVQYEVDGDVGGIIEGDIFQIVSEGEVPSPVMAIAEDGYVFYGWSDGAEDPYRADGPVTGKLVVYAVFVEVEESDDGNSGEGEEGEEGQEGDGSGKGEGEGEGEGDGSGEGEGDQNGDGEGGGMGGSSVPNNQVIDGGTYYGDEYKSSYSDAQDNTNSNSNLNGDASDAINGYYKTIAK